MTSRLRLPALLLTLLVPLGACSAPATTTPTTSPTATATAANATGSITVLGPGTLATAIPELNKAFIAANPKAEVTPNIGHSPAQVIALQQGSPGDVFVTIGASAMTQAKESNLLKGEPQVFSRNRFQIVVPKGNPKGVKSLEDLKNLTVVLADTSTPGGAMGDQLLEKAGITLTPVSREQGPPAVVQKIATGNADAGLAFVTDVKGSDKVDGIDIPDAQQVPVTYQIAVLAKAENPSAAEAYLAFLTTEPAQQVLLGMGFLAP